METKSSFSSWAWILFLLPLFSVASSIKCLAWLLLIRLTESNTDIVYDDLLNWSLRLIGVYMEISKLKGILSCIPQFQFKTS